MAASGFPDWHDLLGVFSSSQNAALDDFASRLYGWLQEQHKGDGSHKAITADSLATTGVVTGGSSGTFVGDLVADNATGSECGIGSLATVNGAALLSAEVVRKLLLLGGVTNGVVIEQRAFASPFTSGTSELRWWLLPWDSTTPVMRFGIISSVPTLMDGGTGSTAMNIGASTRPVATVYANAFVGGETGTYTPVLTFGGGSTGLTYSTQSGTYSKIGNVVTAEGRIVLSAKGSSVGAAQISGLPYSGAAFPACVLDCATGMVGLTGAPFLVLAGTLLIPVQSAATTRNQLTDANFSNTSDLRWGITYRV